MPLGRAVIERQVVLGRRHGCEAPEANLIVALITLSAFRLALLNLEVAYQAQCLVRGLEVQIVASLKGQTLSNCVVEGRVSCYCPVVDEYIPCDAADVEEDRPVSRRRQGMRTVAPQAGNMAGLVAVVVGLVGVGRDGSFSRLRVERGVNPGT